MEKGRIPILHLSVRDTPQFTSTCKLPRFLPRTQVAPHSGRANLPSLPPAPTSKEEPEACTGKGPCKKTTQRKEPSDPPRESLPASPLQTNAKGFEVSLLRPSCWRPSATPPAAGERGPAPEPTLEDFSGPGYPATFPPASPYPRHCGSAAGRQPLRTFASPDLPARLANSAPAGEAAPFGTGAPCHCTARRPASRQAAPQAAPGSSPLRRFEVPTRPPILGRGPEGKGLPGTPPPPRLPGFLQPAPPSPLPPGPSGGSLSCEAPEGLLCAPSPRRRRRRRQQQQRRHPLSSAPLPAVSSSQPDTPHTHTHKRRPFLVRAPRRILPSRRANEPRPCRNRPGASAGWAAGEGGASEAAAGRGPSRPSSGSSRSRTLPLGWSRRRQLRAI